MSGLLGVRRLLLWGGICLWLPGLVLGALFISREEADNQVTFTLLVCVLKIVKVK